MLVTTMDALLLGAHALHYTGQEIRLYGDHSLDFTPSRWWSGSEDGSIMELFGHLKLIVAAWLLIRTRKSAPAMQVLGTWSAILLVMVADDFFMLHEHTTKAAGSLLRPIIPGQLAESASGLWFWAVVALPLGAWLVHSHLTSSARARRSSWVITASLFPMLALGLVFNGVENTCEVCLNSHGGHMLVLLRMTVKHVTMTLVLLVAARTSLGRATQAF